ncbi:AAA family ATPase [Proteinivorax tanatarense]|uniref:AAA family ATPase n=1 Tax=Proteinivorax tanatarense TaxID=1260629 RepID=A0AAU7VMD8_9FIRM
MEEISINRLRSLVDIQQIKISPITVLVGKNSSGKSTFLRTFPLFKQSIARKTSEPILWFDEYGVDFGDFETAKNNVVKNDTIEFGFTFSIKKNKLIFRRSGFDFDDKDSINVELGVKKNYLADLLVCMADQKIKLEFKDKGQISKFTVNDESMITNDLRWDSNPFGLIPEIADERFITYNSQEFFRYKNQGFLPYKSQLVKLFLKKAHSSTKEETIRRAIANIVFGNKRNMYNAMIKSNFPNKLKENLKSLDIETSEFKQINNLLIAQEINHILDICNKLISKSIQSVKYMKPVRANAERYYRIQGLSVDEIDPSGDNIPMFLNNLTDSEKDKFEKWTQERFNLKFSISKKQGHVSMVMKDENTNQSYNLADTGYGYSQILPIIVLLWQAQRVKNRVRSYSLYRTVDSLIVIEQPELHLHPAFQAKLVDLFARIVQEASSHNKEIRFIIETHSETMVNRLGHLIAREFLSKDDVNVLLFDKVENYKTEIESMEFTENGALKNWPIGFFEPDAPRR